MVELGVELEVNELETYKFSKRRKLHVKTTKRQVHVTVCVVPDSKSSTSRAVLRDIIKSCIFKFCSNFARNFFSPKSSCEEQIHLLGTRSTRRRRPRNCTADSLAAFGTSLPQSSPLPVQAVKTAVRRSTQYPPPLLNIKP